MLYQIVGVCRFFFCARQTVCRTDSNLVAKFPTGHHAQFSTRSFINNQIGTEWRFRMPASSVSPVSPCTLVSTLCQGIAFASALHRALWKAGECGGFFVRVFCGDGARRAECLRDYVGPGHWTRE